MKKILLPVIAMVVSHYNALSQIINKSVNDAFLITRMAEKFHVQPKPVDEEFSAAVYTKFLNELDNDKLFFTVEDLGSFAANKYLLDDEIKGRKSKFLQLVTTVYKKRLMQSDTMVNSICKSPFNFTLAEKYTVGEDTTNPANEAAMRKKLYKALKLSVLDEVEEKINKAKPSATKLKKFTDSVEQVARFKTQKSFKWHLSEMLQNPGGIERAVGDEYCKAIANCYDPHTEYFPLTEKENFESELGQKSMVFGFNLEKNSNDNIVIDELLPGSPAFKSGQINKGDKILSIQWEGKEPIDLSDAEIGEMNAALSASNHDNAKLKIKKADGSVKEVTLWKEQQEESGDENKVKSYLLKGAKTLGYLSLPAFYEDWENESGVNGCANDVAKEILKLKKENIAGLIIDLRYNGGGSMQEAVGLSGLFIDAGPVGLTKSRDAKTVTIKDMNRGTIYDGPLLLLVNGYSASASEMVAGTLQDYNRALIVGSPTYGKATAQVVLPMDTTINLESDDFQKIKTDTYLKLTVGQLYRVTGKTAQASGVQPDILIPDALEAVAEKEADNKSVLRSKEVDANKYYKPLTPLQVSGLKTTAQATINQLSYFNLLNQYLAKVKAQAVKKDISLQLTDYTKPGKETAPSYSDANSSTTAFTIQSHAYDNQRLITSSAFKEMDTQWKKFLGKDPYIAIAYELLLQMKE